MMESWRIINMSHAWLSRVNSFRPMVLFIPHSQPFQLMCRTWKYNDAVNEFYIETDEKTTRRLAEIDKTLEQTDMDEI